MKEEIEKGYIFFGPDEKTIPSVRRNLFEKDEQVLRSVIFSYAQKASQDFARIFDGIKVFDNPKSFLDLERLIEYLTEPGDLVLDFFSGTGTTAHGVLRLNKNSIIQRKFICIQLPEPINSDTDSGRNAQSLGFSTIADIGKERIRKVIQQIFNEQRVRLKKAEGTLPGMAEDLPVLDLGFKVFKLDRSNFKIWDGSRPDAPEEELIRQLTLHIDHIDPHASQEDIL